ncbi:aldo/keto reductase [Kaistia sp. UC242_56]|uniref:aldo/keto reductase n=1 Tax=Kaistia sp. UC242_56 TaxID=3374625 RepID=UPI0037B18707
MRLRSFGSTPSEVAIIGQGSWYLDTGDRASAVTALQRGIDAGMTHIDTAEMYGDAELVIGDAIRGRRDGLFLVSKVLPQNASRSGVIAACEQSLKRLGVEQLDCYLLHWRGRYPLEATFEAFEELVRAGKIASWGVSNFDVSDLEDALAASGPGRIACNQVLYHLGERAIEHAVLPWCEENGVAVVAYSPFGHDNFPSESSAGGRVLAEIAAAHNATARQIALAWLAQRSFVIPKASTARHAEDNARAGDIELTQDQARRIDQAFPRGRKPSSLPML